jgi:tetratricopeptide (TPR) repeat protein
LILSNMSVQAFVISSIQKQSCTAIYICVAMWVAGCSSLQSGNELPDSAKLMQEGTQLLDQGQKEKGLAMLSAAARANPASAEPWVKTAQAQFDAENYPAAIVAADEAQKRDPTRKETKAIAVVASLRVAVRALTDMREDSALRGNTRSEAERLARMLRETLGQDVLVPVPQAEEPRAVPKRAASTAPTPTTSSASGTSNPSRTPKKGEPASPKPAATQPTQVSSGGDSNPFSVLK